MNLDEMSATNNASKLEHSIWSAGNDESKAAMERYSTMVSIWWGELLTKNGTSVGQISAPRGKFSTEFIEVANEVLKEEDHGNTNLV